jgi:hypothetical protein
MTSDWHQPDREYGGPELRTTDPELDYWQRDLSDGTVLKVRRDHNKWYRWTHTEPESERAYWEKGFLDRPYRDIYREGVVKTRALACREADAYIADRDSRQGR